MMAKNEDDIRSHLSSGGKVFAVLKDGGRDEVDSIDKEEYGLISTVDAGWSGYFQCEAVEFWQLMPIIMPLEEQVNYLVNNGWREGKPHKDLDRFDRVWYKKFPGEPRDFHNEDKDMQVSVRLWDFRKYGSDFSFDCHLCGTNQEERTAHITSGGISNVASELDGTVEFLLKMWRAIN